MERETREWAVIHIDPHVYGRPAPYMPEGSRLLVVINIELHVWEAWRFYERAEND